MAQGRSSITIRALTEQAVRHYPLYGRAAQGRLLRNVRDAARRAAEAEPERLRFERRTGSLRNGWLSSGHLRPSIAEAVPRVTRQSGQAALAVADGAPRSPAKSTYFPNSMKLSVSPPRKRVTIALRAAVMQMILTRSTLWHTAASCQR